MSLPRLPPELVRLVLEHFHVMRIQKKVRTWLFRHTRHPTWPVLRKQLFRSMRSNDMDALQRCALVRAEWRCEPLSWIFEIDCDSDSCKTIADEVKRGLWDRVEC